MVAASFRRTWLHDATPSTLDVCLELDVVRDGEDVFHRTWEETIERWLL